MSSTCIVIETDSARATERAGRVLGTLSRPDDVILLSGDLGAGKTQLTKGIAEGIGAAGPITSPTFNMLLVHDGDVPLYHFDLYRLDRVDQLEDIDYWETLEAGGVSVVEWGDRFEEAVPAECVVISIEIIGDSVRRLCARGLGARGMTLAAEWLGALADVPGASVETGASAQNREVPT